MANQEQLQILKQGVKVWNKWRENNPDVKIDLSKTNLRDANLINVNLDVPSAPAFYRAGLRRANLMKANLSDTDLQTADLREANLSQADLRGTKLSEADLSEADLSGASLSKADLSRAQLWSTKLWKAKLNDVNLVEANLSDADLRYAILSGADLTKANLTEALLIRTVVDGAKISGSSVYGVNVWDLQGEFAEQKELIVTDVLDSAITVDNIKIAQFIYLILNNAEIRDVINTLTSKTVLILGRFTDERKRILDAIRDELRQRDYLPILFDFDKPVSRDLTETISLLARMARFIVVDLTDPKSVPQELTSIIPDLPSVPIVPIILNSQTEFSMYEHWKRYSWVLKIHRYISVGDLLSSIVEKIIGPAENAVEQQRPKPLDAL